MKQKKCALCGRRMRLHERNNGWPLVDADVCNDTVTSCRFTCRVLPTAKHRSECNYSRVVPTRICGGILSQKVVLENSETEFSGADETEVCSEAGLCPPSSHVETERDNEGCFVYRIVADGDPGGEGGAG